MSTQDTTSNEQKPSAEAFEHARDLEELMCGGRGVLSPEKARDAASAVEELLARVRREARAEAFDEALREAHFTAVVCGSNKAAVVGAIRALAAKERAS